MRGSVMNHIRSFPAVESHYCRSETTRMFLEAGLNVSKMYDLYLQMCSENNMEPVKQSYYRFIFKTEFNLAFHQPKKDRCDRCEEYKVKRDSRVTLNEAEELCHNEHLIEKHLMREERNFDRKNGQWVLCFDLENVITLPKAEISSFFYKRKLTVYNMTGHLSNKQGYCSIWKESTAGRAGDDIASAVVRLIEEVIKDHPEIKDLITWSDSCVPQNRNQMISYAMLDIIRKNEHLNSITMKYSVPGHCCIQEVDNIHSKIENAMSTAEFYSPVSFLRLLVKCNRQKPFRALQMHNHHFRVFFVCWKF